MVDLTTLVKAEKTTSSEFINLRRLFEGCGEIRAIHASGFVEFADARSAERAIALNINGVRVFQVASSSRLVEQYRKVNPSAFAESSRQHPADEKSRRAPASTNTIFRSLKTTQKPVSSHTPPQPSTPVASPSSVIAPKASQNRILIRLCGEIVTLDLTSLPSENPTTVIELLNATHDRGNWLIVAAYYRRTGNPKGAKEVMTAMLDALKELNIPENDLKPAFLLLSGCETDLAKIEKLKGDSKQASEHYSKGEKWLRKVYGENLPPFSQESNGVSALNNPVIRPPGPDYQKMERELQSLRDRNAHNMTLISDFRSSKRKLEDSLALERDVRRRMERELDDLVRERDIARRMANEHLYRADERLGDSRRYSTF